MFVYKIFSIIPTLHTLIFYFRQLKHAIQNNNWAGDTIETVTLSAINNTTTNKTNNNKQTHNIQSTTTNNTQQHILNKLSVHLISFNQLTVSNAALTKNVEIYVMLLQLLCISELHSVIPYYNHNLNNAENTTQIEHYHSITKYPQLLHINYDIEKSAFLYFYRHIDLFSGMYLVSKVKLWNREIFKVCSVLS